MKEERRLVWRVLRHWKEMAESGVFPAATRSMLGCRERTERIATNRRGIADRTFTFCSGRGELGGRSLLQRHLGRFALVAGAAGGVGTPGPMIEGGATLRGVGILYRSAPLPLFNNGVAIDDAPGATNYRPVRDDEPPMKQGIFRTQWI